MGWFGMGKQLIYPAIKKKEKVYCKKCKYFNKKLNDMYYLNREIYPWPNPIPIQCRQSSYKHDVECTHPDNHKEHVSYHDAYDEVRKSTFTNVRSPRSLNYSNDCHWYKEKDAPDWEVVK